MAFSFTTTRVLPCCAGVNAGELLNTPHRNTHVVQPCALTNPPVVQDIMLSTQHVHPRVSIVVSSGAMALMLGCPLCTVSRYVTMHDLMAEV